MTDDKGTEYVFTLPDGSRRYEIVLQQSDVFAFKRMHKAVSAAPINPKERGIAMNDFFLSWSIELSAKTPELAAKEAWECMRAPNSTANVFTVFDQDGKETKVDLTELLVPKPYLNNVKQKTEITKIGQFNNQWRIEPYCDNSLRVCRNAGDCQNDVWGFYKEEEALIAVSALNMAIKERPSKLNEYIKTLTIKMETAMCLWEASLDWFLVENANNFEGKKHHLTEYREGNGAWATRNLLADLVSPCDMVWEWLGDNSDYFGAFDWEFVPWFLEVLIDDEFAIRKNWQEITCGELTRIENSQKAKS